MNKLKRILSFGLTLGLGALALTGCQDKENKDTNKDNGTVVVDNSDNTDTVEAKTYEKGLSAKSYNFEKEFFFDDYNSRSKADTTRQGIDTFKNKDNIVFDQVTYEELIHILESEGNYLILFGGSWCHNTRAAVPFINDYANEYGITTIYNFDFYLDGTTSTTHVRNTNPTDPARANAGTDYNFLYGELVTKYLTNLTDFVEYKTGSTSSVTYTDDEGADVNVAKLQVPFLFLYNKDNTVDSLNGSGTSNANNTYPIVAGFEEMIDLDDKGVYQYQRNQAKEDRVYFTEEYKTRLKAFFEKTKNLTISTYTDGQYIIDAYNTRSGKTIFEANAKINIKPITYRQLVWLLEQEGNSIILLGGTWCGNTQATIKPFNDFAVKNDLTIYNFDTKLDAGYAKKYFGYTKEAHIRDTANPFVNLYADLIEKYFTNITTLYDVNDEASYKHIEYTNKDGEVVKLKKLQVPYLLSYNKDAKDSDNLAAPITGYYEEMLTLVDTRADYVYSETNIKSVKDNTLNVFKAYGTRTGVEAKTID